MLTRHALLLLALSLVMCWSPTSRGCPAQTRPRENAEYPTILLGEVVGVRLTEYAARRQRQIRDGSDWYTDRSLGYEIDVLPIEVLKGSQGHDVGQVITLRVSGGCSIPRADLNQFGLFFLDKQGAAMPMYQDDYEYKKRLIELESRNASACKTRMDQLMPHPCWKPRAATLECVEMVRDFAYVTRLSCPSGVQELREHMHRSVFGQYDSQLPPPDPTKRQ